MRGAFRLVALTGSSSLGACGASGGFLSPKKAIIKAQKSPQAAKPPKKKVSEAKQDETLWEVYLVFLQRCEETNQAAGLDPNHDNLEWNHTLPQCLFGDQPFGQWLTLRQHALASCLQTLAFKKVCFHGKHKEFVPDWLWELAKEASFWERTEWCSTAGKKAKELGRGAASATSEQLSEWAHKGGTVAAQRRTSAFFKEGAPVQRLGGKRTQELGVGLFSQSEEDLRANGRKTTSQRWRCLVTGHVSTPGGLSRWQKARGLDTSLRERLS